MNQLDYKVIGKRVREIRIKRNMTQEKLADTVGVSVPHISNIETGNTKVSLPTLLKIANALGTTVDSILYINLKHSENVMKNDIGQVLEDCSNAEIAIITEMVIILKKALRNPIA